MNTNKDEALARVTALRDHCYCTPEQADAARKTIERLATNNPSLTVKQLLDATECDYRNTASAWNVGKPAW